MSQVQDLVNAYDAFITGCKADGTWTAIKASCIMAGWDGLAGALTPLVGTAPTNVGPFVSGDYDRKTGLVGDGSTKYLDSNRAHNADDQNNHHIAININTAATATMGYISPGTYTASAYSTAIYRNNSAPARLDVRSRGTTQDGGASTATGFAGISRSASGSYSARSENTTTAITETSIAGAGSETFLLFARNTSPVGLFSDARLSFYSIGESLDLALLDTRVSQLITDIDNAIP